MRRRKGWRVQARELLWPSMGWRALMRWVMLKLKRQSHDAHKVALGVALGVGISFLPLPGLAAVISAMVAWALRASVAAALFGQIVGNPWTFPLIWWGSYEVGSLILPTHRMAQDWLQIIDMMSWQYLMDNGAVLVRDILLPVFVGGVVLGVVLGGISYFFVRWEVQRFWDKRKMRRKP